jgi:hypothetical protein
LLRRDDAGDARQARRYGKRQIERRPGEVIADLLHAFGEAMRLAYAN